MANNLSETLSNADKETLKEILREAESYLTAQLGAAIAADQRAINLAGFLSAAVALLIAGGTTLVLATNPHPILGSITFEIAAASVSFGVAAALLFALRLAINAARPANFEFPGNIPSQWDDDVTKGIELHKALAEQCAHYDDMAKTNDNLMKRNGKMVENAIDIVFWALALGGVFFVSGIIPAIIH